MSVPAASAMGSSKHIILVHGTGHGAWCWYKVATLLRSAGYRVVVPDLAASGIDTRHLQEAPTFADYTQPLLDILRALPPEERGVLVGQGYGGMNIALAAEMFLEKIAAAVFVAAPMPVATLRLHMLLRRDMSIATLRTFVAKRKEEHEAMMNKRNKYHQKASRDTTPGSNEEGASTSQHDETDGDHLKELNQATDEAEDLSKETIKLPSWKGTRELKPPVVLEALAAFGLRSLRYAREVDGLGNVVALDNDKASVEACKRNIKFNGLATSGKVETHLADARVYN